MVANNRKYKVNQSKEEADEYKLSMGQSGSGRGGNDIIIRNLDSQIVGSGRQPEHLMGNENAFPQTRKNRRSPLYTYGNATIIEDHSAYYNNSTRGYDIY